MHTKIDLRARAGGSSFASSVASPPRGTSASGRIVKLLIGQGHGFIRVADRREVFFHRADVSEGTSFNKLEIGDLVRFELLEDRFSGARALRVQRRSTP